MAWVAVNKDLTENIFDEKPVRGNDTWEYQISVIGLPKGAIKRLIGKELTWKDEPECINIY